MARSIYDGGKRRRHFTLSDQAFDHLTAIAHDGAISRSETLERLVRSTSSCLAVAQTLSTPPQELI